MSEIETALNAVVALVKTINVTEKPGDRVWAHPGDTNAINADNYPFVVVSKMNADTGAWQSNSFGSGRHEFAILIAVYLSDGPVIVTNPSDLTQEGLENAHEWYKALADLLFANMTLSGTVDIIGDGDGKLYDYVTDNIIWDAKQHYGHLFIVPVVQSVAQSTSA